MTEEQFKALSSHDAWLYLDNAQTQRDEALARIATADAEKASALAAKDAERVEAVAAAQLQLTNLNQQLREAATLIDLMGGTEVGQQMAKAKRRADLVKQRDDLLAAKEQVEISIAEIDRE